MRNEKHTPGPWEVEDPTKGNELPSVCATNFRGEVCCGVFHKADAHLMAASPAMLDQLHLVHEWIGREFTKEARDLLPGWYDIAKGCAEAIAKAEGGEG